MSLAEDIIRRNSQLKGDRQTWDTLWQDLSNYVMPRKSAITEEKTAEVDGWTDDIFDTTAIEANQTLAAGQMSYITPPSERWFEFEHPDSPKDEAAAKWYRECSDITLKELARSNFYLRVHEMYLDRGAFGTGSLYAEEHKSGDGLRFACHAVGSYCISEDEDGMVDTVYREFEMTARQMVQKFGEDVASEVKKLADDGGEKAESKFKLIHAVYPREDRDRGKVDPENKPVASVYVDVKHKKVLQDGGYDEMPYFISRFLIWQDCYGYSPSVLALPTTKGVNHVERCLDALAEVKVFPRTLVPDSLDGNVDLRAGGKTVFDANNPSALPREWGTQGEYNIGKDRVVEKRELIRRAFFEDMFKMLMNRDKQNMTATEVLELLEEKLVLFSPTFMQLNHELLDPMLERVFGILFRQGKFPDPPEQVYESMDALDIVIPKVSYQNKIAKMIRQLASRGILTFFEAVIAPTFPLDPTVLDNIDMDKAVRTLGDNFGVPTDVMRDIDSVEEIRAQRQELERIQNAAEIAKSAGSAAKDFSQANLGAAPATI